MPLLEEVDGGAEGSSTGDAETLKANHRRKRASRARKKKREDVRDVSMHGLSRKTIPFTPVVCGVLAGIDTLYDRSLFYREGCCRNRCCVALVTIRGLEKRSC